MAVVGERGAIKQVRRKVVQVGELLLRERLAAGSIAVDDGDVRRMYEAIRRDLRDLNCANYFLLIVDDNLYYRSMRHEWASVASRCGVQLVGVHVECDLDTCLARNRARAGGEVLDESIIERMAAVFEPPAANEFNDNLLIVKGADSSINEHVSALLERIGCALDTAIEPAADKHCWREADRLATETNVVHQLDCELRAIVRERVGSGNEEKIDGRQYARAKNQLLRDVKNGARPLPDLLAQQLARPVVSGRAASDVRALASELLDEYVNKR